jgi:DNA-binding response OmpR family regulator
MARTILVAEDDSGLRKLMVLRLRDAGYQVATAADGVEALEKAREAPPDAIVSDVVMPRLDGFKLCQAVRQDPRLVSVPVVLVSSATIEQADLVLAQSAGASAYVLRTPGCGEVIGALEDSLGQGPAPAAEDNPALLADLQEQFLSDGQMESRSMLDRPDADFDAESARQLVHRWAGVGGTLGFPRLSQLASRIERQLDNPAAEARGALQGALLEMARMFAETRARWRRPAPVREFAAAPAAAPEDRVVVVADDDLVISALVAATLTSHGIRCHVARHGREALEMTRQLQPSALVLDINMPQMDGFEVLRALKDDPTTASTPVVLLSVRRQEADVLRAFGLGADDYVAKPFNPVELLARLKRVMRPAQLVAGV